MHKKDNELDSQNIWDETQFKTLVSNIPGIVYRAKKKDDWFENLYLSGNVERITGYKASDFLHNRVRTFLSIVHTDDRDRLQSTVSSSLSSRAGYAVEYRINCNDGSEIWVEERASPIYDDSGTLLFLDGILFNITEKKTVLDSLQKAEEKYRILFDTAPIATLVLDYAGVVLNANQEASSTFSYMSEEFQEMHISNLFVNTYEMDLIVGGSPSEDKEDWINLLMKRKDDTTFEALVRTERMDIGDTPVFLVLIQDITEMRKTEHNLRVAAESTNFYIDLMGHDIRNHLQAIMMAKDLLSSQDIPEESQVAIEIISKATEKAKALIEAVESTKGLLDSPLVRINLQNSITTAVKPFLSRSDVAFKIETTPKHFIVNAGQYIVYLFHNIIDNAIEHNPRHTKTVWIQADEDENGYQVIIGDDGSGISSSKKEIIFDPNRRFGGVGIHQALQICEKYGGRINVRDRIKDNPLQGSEFIIWLPKA